MSERCAKRYNLQVHWLALAWSRQAIMSTQEVAQGADAESNAASSTGESLGIGATTNSNKPRVSTGPVQSAKSYLSSPVASTTRSHPDGSNDLTSEGNADTSAVAGAAGSDITASTDYGSKKSANGADDGLEGGLHRPDLLSKGEHIPEGLGTAPRTDTELAANDAKRQQDSGLSGSFNAQDIDAVQQKLEQQHS